jgi:hypothetical protein
VDNAIRDAVKSAEPVDRTPFRPTFAPLTYRRLGNWRSFYLTARLGGRTCCTRPVVDGYRRSSHLSEGLTRLARDRPNIFGA